MARIKNAVKKNVWKTLTPVQRHSIFMHGDAEPWAVKFAYQIYSVGLGVRQWKNPNSVVDGLKWVVEGMKKRNSPNLKLAEKQLADFCRKLPSLLKKSGQSPTIFAKSKKNSLERQIQNFMRAAADLMIVSYTSGSGARLRSLATAIERIQDDPTKPIGGLGFVDDYRFWLNSFLYKSTPPPNSYLTNEPKVLTFPQIRKAFDEFFRHNEIDDKTLREWVEDDLGFHYLRVRRKAKTGSS